MGILSRVGLSDVGDGLAGSRRTTGPSSRGPSAPPAAGVRLWIGLRPQRPRARARRTTPTSSRGSPPSGHDGRRAAGRPAASPCSVTSTSPPPTTTSGTSRPSRGNPRHRAGARGPRGPARPRPRDVIPRALKYDHPSPTGTTGPATSTRTSACASTSSTPTRRSRDAVTDAYVDREARKGCLKDGKGPSDHAPLVVDLAL